METNYKTVKDLKPGDKLYSDIGKTIDVVEVFHLLDTNEYHITIFCKGKTEQQDVTTTWKAKGDSDTIHLFYVDPDYLIKRLKDTIERCSGLIEKIELLK